MGSFLRDFLQKKIIKGGTGLHTHTIKVCPFTPRAYALCIPDDETEVFLKLYCDYLAYDNEKLISLTEAPQEYGPFRADFDFVYPEGDKRQYDKAFLKDLAFVYQQIIREVITDDEIYEDSLSCIFLEKPYPVKTEKGYKDGIHLLFPHFICNLWTMNYVREQAIQKTADLWEGLNIKSSVGEIIDKINNHLWLLYGSVNYKTPESRPYTYTRGINDYGIAFNSVLEEISLEVLFRDNLVGQEEDSEYLLPKLLSIRGFKESDATPLSDRFIKIRQKRMSSRRRNGKKRKEKDITEDLKFIRDHDILDSLSNERTDHEPYWMDVGWHLYTIGDGCEDALEMWIEFSKRSHKFREGDCEKRWERMKAYPNRTLRSLLTLAKQDNPQLIDSITNRSTESLIEKSLETKRPTHGGVAEVVCSLADGKYVCTYGNKGEVWYNFYKHRWRKTGGVSEIGKLVIDDTKTRYEKYKLFLTKGQISKTADARVSIQTRIDRCEAIIEKLLDSTFVNGVIRFCKIRMTDSEFLKKVDNNKYVMGCENGVLDFDMGVFRDGRPDDYITLSTLIDYQEYSENEDEYKDAMDFFNKFLVNERLRRFNFEFTARAMMGCNNHKLVLIYTGDIGNNGKTTWIKILESALGRYIGKFPKETILKSRGNSAGGARTDLARMKGKRIMSFDETARSEKLASDVIKLLTGNDSVYARTIYDDPEDEIRPMFTLMGQTNQPPSVPESDFPLWQRLRVLPCETRFVRPIDIDEIKVPESKEEQFKQKIFHADLNFAEKVPSIASVTLYILFKTALQFETDCVEEPEEVKFITEKYRKSNDVYEKFKNDSLFPVTREKERYVLTPIKIIREFKRWYKSRSRFLEPDPEDIIKREILSRTKEFYDIKKDKWVGLSFHPVENQEEGEEVSEDEFHALGVTGNAS